MIKRLTDDVRGRLRTGVALTSVAQCVEELVLNSVDAGATCVAVRIDLQSLTIQVVDNGQGISKEQLHRVGERYCTSKCHTVQDLDSLRYFGYRGEALASLCSASTLVELVTRPSASTTTYTKCFHKGKPLSVTEPDKPRPGHGTTVTARNLFYNLPVRKKSLNQGLELEKTRFRVAGLALMWPLISFSLRDDITGNVILQTHKCSSILGTFASLFGTARTKHMREVEESNDVFKIGGYVSRENYSRKDLQFVFVNRRLVLKSKVHKVLNSVLAKSVLVRRRGHTVDRSKLTRQEQNYLETGSPTKLFERYAVYLINIDCSLNVYDITFDPAKTLVEFHDWSELTGLLETMLMKFLKEENLLLPTEGSQDAGKQDLEGEASTPTPELCETDDPFEGNDDHIDEELHNDLERKRFAQGISVHSNIHSLSSRTVRRPAVADQQEGFEDLYVSSPKKSKLHTAAVDVNNSPLNQPGHSDLSDENPTTMKVHSSSKSANEDSSCTKTDIDDEEEPENVATCRQLFQTDNNSREKHCDTSSTENEEEREIILPQALGPSKRTKHQPSHKHTFTNTKHATIPDPDSSVKEIRLPQQFAQSSSLSRLRARLACHPQLPSSSSLSSANCETVPSSSAIAFLQKFHRTDKQSKWRNREEERSEREEEIEVDEVPSEIVLPPMSRPSLFKSRSLDAGGPCRSSGDKVSLHRSDKLSLTDRGQVCDDIAVSYTGSNHASHSVRQRYEKSKDRSSDLDQLSETTTERTVHRASDFKGNEQLNISLRSHSLQKSFRKQITDDRQNISSDNYIQLTAEPHKNPTSLTEKRTENYEGILNTRPGHELRSGVAVRSATIFQSRAENLNNNQQTSGILKTNECQSRITNQHRRGAGRPHVADTRQVSSSAVSSVSNPSTAGLSSARSGTCPQSSKLGLSQASKLARLVRQEDKMNQDKENAENQTKHDKDQIIIAERNKQRHIKDNQTKTAHFPDLMLFQTPGTALGHCSDNDTASDKSAHDASRARNDVRDDNTLHLFHTPHTALCNRDTSARQAGDQSGTGDMSSHRPAMLQDQFHAQSNRSCTATGNNVISHELVSYSASSFSHKFNNNQHDEQNSSTRRKKDTINVLETCPETHCEHWQDCGNESDGFCVSHSQNVDDEKEIQGCEKGNERGEMSQQETQGFAALSSQGFLPRLTDMTTMCFDVGSNSLPRNATIADSPISTHSAGFSPAMTDVMIADPDNSSPESRQTVKSSGDKSLSLGNTSRTFASASFDKTPKNVLFDDIESGQCQDILPVSIQTLNTSCDKSLTSSTIGKTFIPTPTDKDNVLCDAAESGKYQDTAVSPVIMKTPIDTLSSSHTSVRFNFQDPDSESCYKINRLQTRNDTDKCSLSEGEVRCSQQTELGCSWPASASETHHPSPGCLSTTHTSDIPDSQAVIASGERPAGIVSQTIDNSSINIPSSSDCHSNCSLTVVPDSLEIVALSEKSSDNFDTRQEDHEQEVVFEHSLPENVREQNTHDTYKNLCPSDDQHLFTALSSVSKSPDRSKRETKRKMIVDRTYNLSFLTGKKSKTSSFTMPERQVADTNSAVRFHSEKEQLHKTETVITVGEIMDKRESETENTGVQQTDSFSDSVPDSAHARIVMPRNQTDDIPASQDMNCSHSVLDRMFANSMTPESQSVLGKEKQTTPDVLNSLPDSMFANVTTPNTLSEFAREKQTMPEASDSLPDRVFANMATPEAQSELDQEKHSSSDLSHSLPDSVFANMKLPEEQCRLDRHTQHTVDKGFANVSTPQSQPLLDREKQTSPHISNSLSDSAFVNVTTPKPQSELKSKKQLTSNKTFANIMTPEPQCVSVREKHTSPDISNSLPDSAFANITTPESLPVSERKKQMTSDKRNIVLTTPKSQSESEREIQTIPSNSLPDSVFANVMTPKSQSVTDQEKCTPCDVSSSLSDTALLQACASENDILMSITPQTDKEREVVTSLPSGESAFFTQNAYNLGSGLPSTTADSRAEESFILTHPYSQNVSVNSFENNPSNMDTTKNGDVNGMESSQIFAKDKNNIDGLQSQLAVMNNDEDINGVQSMSAEQMNEEERGDDRTGTGGGADEVKEVVWVPVVDPATGSTVYMNSSSGHTLTVAQWTERELEKTAHQLSIQASLSKQNTAVATTPLSASTAIEKLSPLSRGTLESLVSNHLEDEEAEARSKWREGCKEMLECDDGGKSIVDLVSSWENPVFKKANQILHTVSRGQAGRLARCFFQPTAFNKSMLIGAKVVGQLDNKFVACVIEEDTMLQPSTSINTLKKGEGGLVVLFDQHAAHERIRLEQLLTDVYEKDGGEREKRIKRCDVQPPRVLDLSEEDVRLMQSFREEYHRIGVTFDVDEDRRDRVHAHTIPACMAQREANDRKRGKDPLSFEYLQIMIREHNQLLRSTAGARQQLPQQVHRLLSTHACKGAIKFGDKLSMSTCQELLSSLSMCDLPFQCAHGRPSIAPLISLSQLPQTTALTKQTPSLWKLRHRMTTTHDQC